MKALTTKAFIILLTFCIGVLFCFSSSAASVPQYVSPVLGDVNSDGKLSEADILLCKSFVLDGTALPDKIFSGADMNADGVLDICDIIMIAGAIESGQTGYEPEI